MSSRRPFRANLSKSGKQSAKQSTRRRNDVARYLGRAALLGAIVGTASIATTADGTRALLDKTRPLAVSFGLIRARVPQEGDSWSGCNAARAAGTAPIYAGEPGYREGMDGDGDGIACEPYGGQP